MSALDGETIVCGQHKGKPVQLVIYGDEFYARYESTDGYTVVYDTHAGCYCYATLVEGHFVSSGATVGKPVPPGIRKHLKESAEVRNEKFTRRYRELRPSEGPTLSYVARTLGPDDGLLGGRKLSHGEVSGLTVLVNFDDITSNITADDVDAMLNGDNYQENGNFSSVRNYFALVSHGHLTYTNRVVGPVTLKKRRSHYITTLLVKEALDIVVNDLEIDLSEFDSRGEGIVNALNFLYAGQTQYSGDLWPHNSVEILNYGGVRTHFYLLTSLGRETVDLSIGTFCHENGHLLCRFPDMYDYGERNGDFEDSQGIGRYCLMGSGDQLNNGRTPSPVCAYLRNLAGWTDTEIILDSPGNYEARHGDYGTVMKYETDKPNEYFLIENRTRLGLDAHLPASGLAIYHCDTLGSNEWQQGTRNRHYQCALLQADGHLDLENNLNRGDEGDLFGQVDGVALADTTLPSSREWDDTDSGLVVSDISPAGDVIQFAVGEPVEQPTVFAETSPHLLIPDDDENGIRSRIDIDRAGRITGIEVGVDIIHTWIGDLRVTLEAPTGEKVILHNRAGRHQDDIKETYNVENTANLAELTGKPLDGQWNLHIVDLEGQDIGRLNRWSLEIAYSQEERVIEGTAEPDMAIPDWDAEGITSAIHLDAAGTAKDISVDIDIEHTYIGDLRVDLVAPSGVSARLHTGTGGTQNNLKRSYDLVSAPALENLLGHTVDGDWKLSVRDLAPIDEGSLRKWSVRIVS
jgi:M6 family metalloprotease-like protein